MASELSFKCTLSWSVVIVVVMLASSAVDNKDDDRRCVHANHKGTDIIPGRERGLYSNVTFLSRLIIVRRFIRWTKWENGMARVVAVRVNAPMRNNEIRKRVFIFKVSKVIRWVLSNGGAWIVNRKK